MTDWPRRPATKRAMVHDLFGLAAEYFSCSIWTWSAPVASRPPKYWVQSTPSHVSRGKPASSRKPSPSTAIAWRPSSFDRRRIACRVAHSSWKSSPVFEPRAPLKSINFVPHPPVRPGPCQARQSSSRPRTSHPIPQPTHSPLQAPQTHHRDSRLRFPMRPPRQDSRNTSGRSRAP